VVIIQLRENKGETSSSVLRPRSLEVKSSPARCTHQDSGGGC
jgi:hypothetical protein